MIGKRLNAPTAPRRDRRDHEPLLLRRTRAVLKHGVRVLVPVAADSRRVLAVFGCQRSGTTMLQQSLLDRSWRSLILEEHDRRLIRADDKEHLRWDDLETVAARVRALPFELVVVKPLVESHRALHLLDRLTSARGIWMLRHYVDVAESNVRRFGLGNGLADLRMVVAGDTANWRASATGEVRDRVAALLASGLSPIDAAAVFWWVRNRLYLDQGLAADGRIRVMRYEAMIDRRRETLEALSRFLGLRLPTNAMLRHIRPAAVARKQLRPDVEQLCHELLEKFRDAPDLLAGG